MSVPSRSGAAPVPGYLVVRIGDDGSYIGGLMVTDAHGLPLDFRYTDPVTPTRLQRALYGGVLDRYLRSEVVLRTLLGAVQQKPSVLLVDDDRLLDEDVPGCPVAYASLSRAGTLAARGAVEQEGEGVFLVQVTESGPPVRVAMAPSANGAAAAVADGLVRLADTMDVLEPAERVRSALDLIAAGEDGA
ncbi:MAG: hypothetical protein AB1416_11375 [Actinomycetota bacterium]